MQDKGIVLAHSGLALLVLYIEEATLRASGRRIWRERR